MHHWIKANHQEIVESNIIDFFCGESLLEFLKNNFLDLIFLDGQMQGINGIDVAKKIRETDKTVVIIMITDFDKYATKGYRYDVMDYINKAELLNEIDEVFDKACIYIKRYTSQYIEIKIKNNYIRVNIPDIIYCESSLRKIKMYLFKNKEIIEFYSKLDDLELKLKKNGFIRPHNSFLVNSEHICEFHKDSIKLSDDTTIPVAKRRHKDAEKDFINCSTNLRKNNKYMVL